MNNNTGRPPQGLKENKLANYDYANRDDSSDDEIKAK